MQFQFIHIDGAGNVRGNPSADFGTPVNFSSGRGGIFANWRYADNTLAAEVDPYGVFSLFYSTTRDGVMLSPSPIELIAAGANPEIDWTALACFHMLGWYIGEDTPFKHIKVLPPAGRLTWSRGRMSIEQRPHIRSGLKIDRDAAIREYDRLFAKAVKACWEATSDRIIIPLSGGRDSRHILLESMRQGFQPDHCVTYDPTFGNNSKAVDPEWECAKQLADKFGLRHEKIKTLQSKYAEQLHTIYLTHLGTDEHVHYMALTRHLGGKSLLDGIGGDTLSRNKTISTPELRAMSGAQRVDLILAHFDKVSGTTLADRLGKLGIGADVIKQARQRIIDCYDSYADQPDQYSHFFFWQRTRREIGLAPGGMLANARNVLCPYLDPGLVEFCLSLPDEVTADGKFHDRVIEHSFPNIRVPYHDEFERILLRPSIARHLRIVSEAVTAKSSFGLRAMVREVSQHAMMLADQKSKRLYFWRTYHQVLGSIAMASPYNSKTRNRSETGSRGYLQTSATID